MAKHSGVGEGLLSPGRKVDAIHLGLSTSSLRAENGGGASVPLLFLLVISVESLGSNI